MPIRYIANTPAEQREMLRTIGAGSIEGLLVKVPAKARLARPLALPDALAETDLVRHLRARAATNADADGWPKALNADQPTRKRTSRITLAPKRRFNFRKMSILETCSSS